MRRFTTKIDKIFGHNINIETKELNNEIDPLYDALAKYIFELESNYWTSFPNYKNWSNHVLPEIAFMGASNAGKSSMINHVLKQNKLANGHTQMLNLYRVGERILFVDMPGYGHKSRFEWNQLVMDYLTHSKLLKKVFILIESKRGVKEIDQLVIRDCVDLAVPFQIVLTKCDKLLKSTHNKSRASLDKQQLEDFLSIVKDENKELLDWVSSNAITCDRNVLISSTTNISIGVNPIRSSIIQACGITDTKIQHIEHPKKITKIEKRIKKSVDEIKGPKIIY